MERSQQRNISFDYDIKQTRDKFKRCVSVCREAALKIKTASGIQRFQEEKEYGTWFSKLYPVAKSMDSCQPEQSIEPDAEPETESPTSLYGEETSTAAASSSSTETRKRKLFVHIHETSKKKLKCREDTLQASLNSIQEALSNDPTKEFCHKKLCF